MEGCSDMPELYMEGCSDMPELYMEGCSDMPELYMEGCSDMPELYMERAFQVRVQDCEKGRSGISNCTRRGSRGGGGKGALAPPPHFLKV